MSRSSSSSSGTAARAGHAPCEGPRGHRRAEGEIGQSEEPTVVRVLEEHSLLRLSTRKLALNLLSHLLHNQLLDRPRRLVCLVDLEPTRSCNHPNVTNLHHEKQCVRSGQNLGTRPAGQQCVRMDAGWQATNQEGNSRGWVHRWPPTNQQRTTKSRDRTRGNGWRQREAEQTWPSWTTEMEYVSSSVYSSSSGLSETQSPPKQQQSLSNSERSCESQGTQGHTCDMRRRKVPSSFPVSSETASCRSILPQLIRCMSCPTTQAAE